MSSPKRKRSPNEEVTPQTTLSIRQLSFRLTSDCGKLPVHSHQFPGTLELYTSGHYILYPNTEHKLIDTDVEVYIPIGYCGRTISSAKLPGIGGFTVHEGYIPGGSWQRIRIYVTYKPLNDGKYIKLHQKIALLHIMPCIRVQSIKDDTDYKQIEKKRKTIKIDGYCGAH